MKLPYSHRAGAILLPPFALTLSSPRKRFKLAAALPLLSACTLLDPDATPANPQRPGLSTSTGTTALGTLELEAGVASSHPDAFGSPSFLKYGLGATTEIFAGLSPYVHSARPGFDGRGVGDVFVGGRHRVFEEANGLPSGAVTLTGKIPTSNSADGIGSGKADFFVAGILTKSFNQLSVTGFYQFGMLGQPGNDTVDLEHGFALAASHPVLGPVSANAEYAALVSPEQHRSQAFTTLGLSVALSPAVVFDIGGVIGVTNDATNFQVIAGFNLNFGGPSPD